MRFVTKLWSPLARIAALMAILCLSAGAALAATDSYRLMWNDDPTTTMTIGWNQVSGSDQAVHYGASADGTGWTSQTPDRQIAYREMQNNFVRLKDLEPGTAYYFQIRDSEGSSETMWFKTAPATIEPFTFITGGDSRTNKDPRVWGNKLVAKIRPLFILHNGDYLDDGTAAEWAEWMTEWQETRSDDGRMYPIIATHGNHENDDMEMMYNIFDVPNENCYYALGFGDYLRVYVLNTELEPNVGYGEFEDQDDMNWNAQSAWYANDLSQNAASYTWLVTGYHRPLRPHTADKSEGEGRITAWADAMYNNGMDLVVESDTHMVKYTYPLKPSASAGSYQGFARDDDNGVMFIGEGSWGAPTRPTNDDKPWTMDSDSFWQFKLAHVDANNIKIRTVRFGYEDDYKAGVSYDPDTVTALTQAQQDADAFAMPAGLDIWKPLHGEVLTLPFSASSSVDVNTQELIGVGDTWKYLDDGSEPSGWTAADFDDSAWTSGAAQLGYGDGDEAAILSYGGDDSDKHMSYYFRNTFSLADASKVIKLRLWLQRDDGAVVYINGSEAARSNMPSGSVTGSTAALSSIGGEAEDEFVLIELPADAVTDGTNTVAVEVHQSSASSSDLSFDMTLTAVVETQTGTAPSQPADLAADSVATNEISLTWSDVSSEDGWVLERKGGDCDYWMVLSNRLKPDAVSYVDDGLAAETEYTYRLAAYNEYGLSTYSAELKATTPGEPKPSLFAETFDTSTLGQLSQYSVASNKDWEASEQGGEDCAYMNGYGADVASEDWLITPKLNAEGYGSPVLSFDMYVKYDGGSFGVYVSTDYSGTGDPTAATWTLLPVTLPEDNSREWTPSGEIDLSAYSGQDFYIAYKYTSTGTSGGDGAGWCVDNVKVMGERSTLTKEDFNDQTLGVWTAYSVASNVDWAASAADGQDGAVMNGYGADVASEDWLISPAMNFNRYTYEKLAFNAYCKYSGGAIEAYISTDYDGSGNPNDFTWEVINAAFPADDSRAWTAVGPVDISSHDGKTVYVGFKYTSTGTGGGDGAKWYLDDIEVSGLDKTSKVLEENFNTGQGQFDVVSKASNADWEPGTVDDRDCMLANGFGADEPSDDWLISPAIDLSSASMAYLSFMSYCKYSGPALEVYISTDYSSAARADADWTDISSRATVPGDDSRVWTESGDVDISDFAGETVNVAFRYVSTGTGSGEGAKWYVDDAVVRSGSSSGSSDDNGDSDGDSGGCVFSPDTQSGAGLLLLLLIVPALALTWRRFKLRK